MSSDSNTCWNCGRELSGGASASWAESDPKYQARVYVNKKSTGVALILSLLVAGLGQMYVGGVRRGALLLLAYLVCVMLALTLLFNGSWAAGAILYLLCFVVWIYGMYDAYKMAQRYNAYLLSHDGNPPSEEEL